MIKVIWPLNKIGSGQVVILFVVYSSNLSSNPAEVYNFYWVLFEKNEN